MPIQSHHQVFLAIYRKNLLGLVAELKLILPAVVYLLRFSYFLTFCELDSHYLEEQNKPSVTTKKLIMENNHIINLITKYR